MCLVCALAVAGIGLLWPKHNWDMIGYAAAAQRFDGGTVDEIHREVYRMLEASVAPEVFRELTRPGSRATRQRDSSVFAELLPFYEIRPAYNLLLWGVHRLGVPIFAAIRWTSALLAAFALLVLCALYPRGRTKAFVYGLPLLVALGGLYQVARFGTPDALGALVVMIVYRSVLRGNRTVLFLLPVLVAVRTDLVLLAGLIAIHLLRSRRFPVSQTVLSAACALAVYFGVIAAFDGHGWSTTFYYTFVERTDHPGSNPPVMSASLYFGVLGDGLVELVQEVRLILVLACAWLAHRRLRAATAPLGETEKQDYRFLLWSSLAYILLHFILFPTIWTRFFAAQYLLVTSLLVHLWGRSTTC